MDMTQSAMPWYKTLLSELRSAVHIGIEGPAGRRAKRRVDALIELFFGLSKELELAELLEIGANNAETSRHFVTISNEKHALAIRRRPPFVNARRQMAFLTD